MGRTVTNITDPSPLKKKNDSHSTLKGPALIQNKNRGQQNKKNLTIHPAYRPILPNITNWLAFCPSTLRGKNNYTP